MDFHKGLPTSGRSKTKPSLPDLLERLRITLANDEKEWSEFLNVSTDDYKLIRTGRKEISIYSLSQLASHLELTLESMMSGNIDFRVLAARSAGNRSSISERYSQNGRSLRRSAFNLLNATEEFFGWQARVMAMRHLQITEAAFADLEDTISLHFNTDLCDYLHRNYNGVHRFYEMGAYSIITNYNTPFGRTMAQHRSLEELYQFFVEEVLVKHWEQNYQYRITKLTPVSCRIESVPDPEVAAALGVKNPGSSFICLTKVGVTACIPGYMSRPFANVREVSCVHNGDSKCAFEVDFELAAHRNKREKQLAFA